MNKLPYLRIGKAIVFFVLLSCFFTTKGYAQIQDCAGLQTSSGTPEPIPNHYYSGQTDTFCYTVQGYTQWGSNWFHGMVFNFGVGWDTSSIKMISLPGSCDGDGTWNFYKNDYPGRSSRKFGMGVYYDRTVRGGTWSPNNPGDTIPGNNQGDYTVTGSCVWTLCFSIKVNYKSNGQDLSFSITPTGDGTTGNWSNQLDDCNGSPFVIVPPGVTSIPNCKPLRDSVTVTKTACAVNNGTATSFASGAYPPYVYSWTNGKTNNGIVGLPAGNYCTTVTDVNNCTAFGCVTVLIDNTVKIAAVSSPPRNIPCFGGCDGFINVSASGGTGTYTYNWFPATAGGPADFNLSGLCAGNYAVTVADANQCTRDTSFLIQQFVSVQASATVVPITCNGGCDGGIAVIPIRGKEPFTYAWSNHASDSAVSNLCSGIYHVTLTDANGCSLDIQENLAPPARILLNETIGNITCFGFKNGYIVILPSQGRAPYAVIWSIPPPVTGDSITQLATGLYNVTVTDANNCTVAKSYFIGQPSILVDSINSKPTSCPGATDGRLEVVVQGGTPPYNYLWNTRPAQTTPVASNLPPGIYTVSVNDSLGCKLSDKDTVTSAPLFTVSASSPQEIKKYSSTELMVTVSQSGNYDYDWTPPLGLNHINVVDPIASPLVTTTYIVEVIDRNSGCRASDSTVVTVLPTDFVYLPNAFSPNGDGTNDLFAPIKGQLVKIIDFKIFDRWGNLVFDDPNGGWNGKRHNTDEPVASYAWFVVYQIEGDSKTYKEQGNVTLIR